MKDPACRVAPERGGPSRKRRPSPSSGSATDTPARPRRPFSVASHLRKFAAQRPNRNGTLVRRDAAGWCARATVRQRPSGKERGKSACGSEQETPHPQERAAWDRVRPPGNPLRFPRSRSSPEGPRLQAWFAQRIERVAARQRPESLQILSNVKKGIAKFFRLEVRAGHAFRDESLMPSRFSHCPEIAVVLKMG